MKFLLIALTLSCSIISQAAESGKSQTLTSPDQVPEGLAKSDWQSIRQAYQAAKFRSAKNAGLTTQQAYLKASNTGANDFFGLSVAVSGDTVVVGASGEDSNAVGVNGNQNDNGAGSSGAAYVFVRSNGVWSQQAYLKASNTEADDEFGFSVAVSEDTVVIGAIGESSSATGVNGNQGNNSAIGSGAAYVFVRSGETWSQQAYLKASNTEVNGRFGWSVAVSEDTAVIGAIGESGSARGINGNQTNNSAIGSGAAYVFVRSGAVWSQQAYLKASNTGVGDQFGTSVAIARDTAIVGARLESSNAVGVNGNQGNNSAIGSGAAYMFVRSGETWSQQAYLKASNTGVNDQFGASVAISGDTVVVGARFEASSAVGINANQIDDSVFASGAAYVFVRSGIAWSQQAYLKASNTGEADFFGESVAIAGNTVIVGATGESSSAEGVNGNQADNSANASGAAYVFARRGGIWSQQAYLKASNIEVTNFFGKSVAISGELIVVGAFFEHSNNTGVNTMPNNAGTADSSGAAYIFDFTASAVPLPTQPQPPAAAQFQVSVKAKSKLGKVTGAGSFVTGSTVALNAKPKKGRKFVGWFENQKLISKKRKLVIANLTANRLLAAKFK